MQKDQDIKTGDGKGRTAFTEFLSQSRWSDSRHRAVPLRTAGRVDDPAKVELGAYLVYFCAFLLCHLLPAFIEALPNQPHCHCIEKAGDVCESINWTNTIPLVSSRLALNFSPGGF